MNIFVENDGCWVLWESTIYMNILVASSPCSSSISGTPSLYESGHEHTLFLARPVEEQADVPRMSPRDESSTMLVEILMTVPKPITLTADMVVHNRRPTLTDGMVYLTEAPRNTLRYSCH